MRMTEVLILAVQFAVVSARLTVLTGKEDAVRSDRKSRELVCVSDDDGAGLTWNRNLNWTQNSYHLSDSEDVTPFQNPNEPQLKSPLDCELNQTDSCISSWSTKDWSLTSSMETPMGPVLDRRWEGFKEKEEMYSRRLSKQSMFVVSIRNKEDADIYNCEFTDGKFTLCYWLSISSSVNTRSTILICPTNTGILDKIDCKKGWDSVMHAALSPFEWKTFVVTWNESTRNMSVYDSERMILTLVDSEKRLSKQNTYHQLWFPGNRTSRLHEYNFLHTTKPYAVLGSPEMVVKRTNFCVEMAVGLCAECQLELVLTNSSTKKVVHTLEVINGSPTVHGLPAWRYVRVNRTISLGNSKVELRMFTILRQETPNPLWAVANVRMCPPADSIRRGKMKTIEDVTCQKLFYNENTVVNSLPLATLDKEFVSADSDCQSGKVGPHCSISCTADLQLEADCKYAKICEEAGCICSLGYTGPHCDERYTTEQSTKDWLLPIFTHWVCPIMLVLILAVAAFYFYKRGRMSLETNEGPSWELLPSRTSPGNTLAGGGCLRVGPEESKS